MRVSLRVRSTCGGAGFCMAMATQFSFEKKASFGNKRVVSQEHQRWLACVAGLEPGKRGWLSTDNIMMEEPPFRKYAPPLPLSNICFLPCHSHARRQFQDWVLLETANMGGSVSSIDAKLLEEYEVRLWDFYLKIWKTSCLFFFFLRPVSLFGHGTLQECTFFTRKEIIHVFNVFYKMGMEYDENKANGVRKRRKKEKAVFSLVLTSVQTLFLLATSLPPFNFATLSVHSFAHLVPNSNFNCNRVVRRHQTPVRWSLAQPTHVDQCVFSFLFYFGCDVPGPSIT